VILEHYRAPANRRVVEHADVEGFSQNPLCGDEITVAARIRDGLVADAGFQARGCSISQASADMMIDAIRGRTLDEVAALAGQFRAMMAGAVDGPASDLGDLAALQGVRRFPVRVKCALLPWNTLEAALAAGRPNATVTEPG
jgi:nitrogen fixation NifU-like protein